jgi:redox-sensitive bicupin YhaK (pirin superfamily)
VIELRPYQSLGAANLGWLDAKHHFSFGDYHAPDRLHWGALRVWNDDTIQPGTGFAAHEHHDMEIITYVREGAITHRDNLGNEGRTEAGDVQVMSAGTGIQHSEYNREKIVTRIFQIWIIPDGAREKATWGARPFPKMSPSGQFVTLASGMTGDEDALPIRARARVAGATIGAGKEARYLLGKGRHAYLVPAVGRVEVDGIVANAGDGVAIKDTLEIKVQALADSEIVLVDVP